MDSNTIELAVTFDLSQLTEIVDQGTGLLRDYNHDTLIDLLNTIIAAMKDSNDEQKKQINDFIEEYYANNPIWTGLHYFHKTPVRVDDVDELPYT